MLWKKLTEKDYKKIASKHGIFPTDVYVKFMKKRFPDEACEGYASEWAGRFKSGDPTPYMDSQSLKAYLDVVKKLRKVA